MKCSYKNIVRALDFCVVNASAPAAFSLKVCKGLSLIKVVMTVDSEDGRKTDQLIDEFEDVFKGQGCIQGEYSIQIKPEVSPVVHAARKVPVALREKVQEELNRMEKLNIITKVDEPTEWVNSMVVVPKPNGAVRICLDPKDLNAAIKREHYKMPTLDEITCQLAGARWFTLLDATSGYWVHGVTFQGIIQAYHIPHLVVDIVIYECRLEYVQLKKYSRRKWMEYSREYLAFMWYSLQVQQRKSTTKGYGQHSIEQERAG